MCLAISLFGNACVIISPTFCARGIFSNVNSAFATFSWNHTALVSTCLSFAGHLPMECLQSRLGVDLDVHLKVVAKIIRDVHHAQRLNPAFVARIEFPFARR